MKLNRGMIVRFLFIFLFVNLSRAQEGEVLDFYKKKYPNSDLVKLKNEKFVKIYLEKGQIKIKENTVEEKLYLTESANRYSKESVSYSSFYDLEKITAASFELQNGKYKENKITEFKEKDELDGSFHDDLKSINFIYPNLNKGSKSILKLQENIKNPRFLSAFYFGGYYPTVSSKLTLTVDKNIDLVFNEFHVENLDIKFFKKEKKKKIIYTWEVKNIAPFEMESGTPNYRNYYPHIVPRISKYRIGKEDEIHLLSETKDLYSWYYSLVKEINQKPFDTELKALVEELTKDKQSELEKVRSIYYWVQNNIKYIAFEYALGGFVPREANDIYKKKYGDCKDNSSILYEMFRIANIKGNLTWIGTRSVPYTYEEMPTPAVDNHMILTYKNGSDIYFLDATGRYMPLEYPSSFIQGKEALIGKDEEFEIYKVPVIPAEKNQVKDSISIIIKDEVIKGSGIRSYKGYPKINIFNSLESIESENDHQDFYNYILRKGNNKFLLKNYEETNKYSYDEDFLINYDFVLSDYLVKYGDELYVNLNLNKIMESRTIEDTRKTDLEYRYKKMYTFTSTFEIPENYNVEYVPENLEINSKLFHAQTSYIQKENKIIYKHTVKFNALMISKEDQKKYIELSKKVQKSYKEVIILKKK